MTEVELIKAVKNLRPVSMNELVRRRLAITAVNADMEIVYTITERGRRFIGAIKDDCTSVARPREYHSGDIYDGADLKPFDGRPGAMAAYGLPSLVYGRRVWRAKT